MLKGHVLRCTDLVSYPRSCYVSSTSVTQFPICERRRRGQGWRFSLLRIHHLGWRQQRSLMSWPGSSFSTSQVVTASTKLCTSCPLSLQSYSPFVLHKEPRQRAKPRWTAQPPGQQFWLRPTDFILAKFISIGFLAIWAKEIKWYCEYSQYTVYVQYILMIKSLYPYLYIDTDVCNYFLFSFHTEHDCWFLLSSSKRDQRAKLAPFPPHQRGTSVDLWESLPELPEIIW